MEAALRQSTDPSVALRYAADMFMGGRFSELIHTMVKVYVLHVHRADMTWMTQCHDWIQRVSELKQQFPTDHSKWQKNTSIRDELCQLVTRLVRAPKQFYLEYLEEWGIRWPDGHEAPRRETQAKKKSDATIAMIMQMVQNDPSERERVKHLIQMNNESYDESHAIWQQIRSCFEQIVTFRSRTLSVSSSSSSSASYQEEAEHESLDGQIQTFFYLMKSLLFDAHRQFGKHHTSLTNHHLWTLLQDAQDQMVPTQGSEFEQVLQWATPDRALQTSAFLVACMITFSWIKHQQTTKKMQQSGNRGYRQAMQIRQSLLQVTEEKSSMTPQESSVAAALHLHLPLPIIDPATHHEYEKQLGTCYSLQSTHGGRHESSSSWVKNTMTLPL